VWRPTYLVEKQTDELMVEDEHKSKLEFLEFKNAGGKTIVDATGVDYGRDVEAVKRIADQTGIKIVATAGFNKSFLWSAQLPEHVQNVVGNYHTYYEWIDNATINELTY